MREDTLPSPGLIHQGYNLRKVAASAISSVECVAAVTAGGKVSSAKTLSDFFTACATALSGFLDVTVPTVVSRAIQRNYDAGNVNGGATPGAIFGNTLRIRHSELLDPKFVPAPAAFAIAGVTKVISKVEIDGPDVILTVTVPWAAGNVSTLAYTQPGATTNLRDLSGNLVASYTAQAVTNPLV